MYVALGAERTVDKVIELVKATPDIKASPSTIRRWSWRLRFHEMAERTDAKVVAGVAEAALPIHRERVSRDLHYINIMKEDFYRRIDAGKIHIDLPEFLALLKSEALLLGDPTERREEVHTTKLQHELNLTDSQLKAILRVTAAAEFGLPPPDDAVESEIVQQPSDDVTEGEVVQ
jgi:hypothetical protein